jgi:L-seryl-tRNA(Ser) seleniumtransferase
MEEKRSPMLKAIPKIDDVLSLLKAEGLFSAAPREIIVDTCRAAVGEIRKSLLVPGGNALPVPSAAEVADTVRHEIQKIHQPHLRRVVNATGIILHTNLGRAPLCDEALERIREVGRGYSNLEFDLEKGKRGLRYDHVKDILCKLTGAQDALVVNNNAAAVLLVLNTLAEGKEAIVSRGELIEIGGEFRVPEVMMRSGAYLREIGTTNRTHVRDYLEAIHENTAIIMKVHTSNFKIVGFTEEVDLATLVKLGRDHHLPVMNDLGSGCFIELDRYGLEREPTVREVLQAGADIVTFSGDKLLGGPQAGIILGREDLLKKLKDNPLNRALRIDKLTLAALEGTLKQYLFEDRAVSNIRALKTLTEPLAAVEKRCRKLLKILRKSAPQGISLALKNGHSMAGGGSLPTQEIPTSLISIRCVNLSASEIEARLRCREVPIVARIFEEEVLLDLRTLDETEFSDIKDGLAGLMTAGPGLKPKAD